MVLLLGKLILEAGLSLLKLCVPLVGLGSGCDVSAGGEVLEPR